MQINCLCDIDSPDVESRFVCRDKSIRFIISTWRRERILSMKYWVLINFYIIAAWLLTILLNCMFEYRYCYVLTILLNCMFEYRYCYVLTIQLNCMFEYRYCYVLTIQLNCTLQYRTHSFTYKTAHTDACKTHCNIPVYTTVFLKMNPRGSKHAGDIKN